MNYSTFTVYTSPYHFSTVMIIVVVCVLYISSCYCTVQPLDGKEGLTLFHYVIFCMSEGGTFNKYMYLDEEHLKCKCFFVCFLLCGHHRSLISIVIMIFAEGDQIFMIQYAWVGFPVQFHWCLFSFFEALE